MISRTKSPRPRLPPTAAPGGGAAWGRFTGLPFALKTVASLLVLAAFLTLADRWAVLYAEHRAADTLKDRLRLSAAPEVEIGGFPFLTQLAVGTWTRSA